MSLTEQELKQIGEVVADAVAEKHKDFWVNAEEHYKDHMQLAECRQTSNEWKANHRFVSEVRQAATIAKKVTLRTAIGTTVAAVIGYILWMIGVHKGLP